MTQWLTATGDWVSAYLILASNWGAAFLGGWSTYFEWSATISGLAGAWLVATHSRYSRLGWIAFLLANLTACAFAIGIQRHGLLLQQVGFIGSSLLGLARARQNQLNTAHK